MLKVLIVDDEVLVRTNLMSLLNWEENGFVVCGEATNGKNAMEMIEKLTPQIIIMDICMPIMDGVELSWHISQKYKNSKMIVLSSYDDYDYVRETLKNGAVDYILKHRMDSITLLKILNKAKEQIEEQIRQMDMLIQSEKKLELAENAIKENYIKELVLGINNNGEQLKDYFDILQLQLESKDIVVVAMQVVAYLIITSHYSDKEKGQLTYSISNICTQIINEMGQGTITHLGQGRFVLLLSYKGQRSESHIYQWTYNYMNRISIAIYRYLNIQIVWGSSNLCTNYRDLLACYQRASRIINGNFNTDASDKRQNERSRSISLNIKQEKNILAAIEMKDMDEIRKIFDEIFQNLKHHGASYDSLQIIITELLTIALRAAGEFGIEIQNIYNRDEYKNQFLKQGERIEDIQKWIKEVYFRLIQLAQTKHIGGQYSNYVNNAIGYLRDHYKENISLQETAEAIGITPSYLSRLFKEATGESFITYLNSIRVEMTQELIKRGERNIKVLYGKVGFNSYNYFFTVFREMVGCTPLTYIKNIQSRK